jgi:hypothetical protein
MISLLDRNRLSLAHVGRSICHWGYLQSGAGVKTYQTYYGCFLPAR